MYSIGIVGCGNLGSMIADGILDKLSKYYKVIAVLDNYEESANNLAQKYKCVLCKNLQELLSCKLDFVIEAASPDVLKDIGLEVLKSGSELIPLSIGALANDEFYVKLLDTAIVMNKKIHLVSGAIGGFDLMRATSFAGEINAKIVTRKSPKSLLGAPGVENKTLSNEYEEVVFEGNAREAIRLFPKNVNVAVALAICTVGVNDTKVVVISDPYIANNIHTIELNGNFGEAKIMISSFPSKENPRSSKLAAMSVLAKLESLASPISYF